MLLNITSVANVRAAVTPSNRSRTTARAITIPAPPASPWRNRTTISAQIEGAMRAQHRGRAERNQARSAAAGGGHARRSPGL